METAFSRFSQIVAQILDLNAVEEVASAVESGTLTPHSTAVARHAIAQGRTRLEALLHRLQKLWIQEAAFLTPPAMGWVLRSAAQSMLLERRESPMTQVVWTGPEVEGSYVRATREVIRELIREAKRELLVVGYWLAAKDEGEGIVEELVELLSHAVQDHVDVTMVLDERKRPDGTDNKIILESVWPEGVRLPQLFTWHLPHNDRHLKLHAKVIVADGEDGLVTSANLTRYAMDLNMEMGVRVIGKPATAIARHFSLLRAHRIIAPL